jgi:hypothetical protein
MRHLTKTFKSLLGKVKVLEVIVREIR